MIIKNNNIIKNTFKNFLVNYKSLILFEMLYKLIVICIFVPATQFFIKLALSGVGEFTVTNTEIVKHLFSIPVITAAICVLITSFIGMFIELSTITYIANGSRENKKISYTKGIINSVKILKKSMSIYIIPMVLLLGILGPITHIGIKTSLVKKIAIPEFIKGELFKLDYGRLIFYIFMFILVLITSRWIYSIIAMVIEDIKLKESFKHSAKINKNSKGKTIYYLIIWGLCNIGVKVILFILYYGLVYTLLTIVGYRSTLAQGIFYISIILFIIGYSLVSVVTTPLFITFLLELYYKYKNYDVKERDNRISISFNLKQKTKNIINILIIVLFILSAFTFTITSLMNGYSSSTKITAHRGSSLRAPENSLTAIEYAIQEKADYAEIDVMTTKDNKVVLFHDTTLRRIAGSNRKIKDMTLEEVKKIDNGSYFSKEFSNEKIPTLEEVFEKFKGKIKFNIELKPTGKDDKLIYEVSKLINKYEMSNQVVVSSLDKNAIITFKNNNIEIESGYIISFAFGNLSAINVDFMSIEYDLLSASLVDYLHMYSKKVHVWTLNDKKRITRAINLGVDNIITDDVLLAKKTLYDLKYKDYMRSFLFSGEAISYSDEEYEMYGEYIDNILSNLNYRTWFKDIVKDILMQVRI